LTKEAEATKKAQEKAWRKLRLPRWLRANKTILAECLKQLFTKASWTWTLLPGRLPVMRNTKPSPLVNLSVATNFCFKQVWIEDTVWYPGNPSGLNIPQDERLPLSSFLPLLGTSTKVLSFEFDYHILTNFPLNRSLSSRLQDVWTVHPTRLHDIPFPQLHLKELNIRLRVDGTTLQGPIDDQALASCLRTAMESGVVQVGELLVGQDGQLTVQVTLPAGAPYYRWG
jgi:hypothetical protein